MLYKIVFGLFLLSLSDMSYSADENRFSMKLEYELIDACIGENKRSRDKAIEICVCTLQKTMENGWWPDYKDDEDFLENQEKFMRDFRKNRIACQKQSK